MNRESVLTDLAYAARQCRIIVDAGVAPFSAEYAQRALDALERVEEALADAIIVEPVYDKQTRADMKAIHEALSSGELTIDQLREMNEQAKRVLTEDEIEEARRAPGKE